MRPVRARSAKGNPTRHSVEQEVCKQIGIDDFSLSRVHSLFPPRIFLTQCFGLIPAHPNPVQSLADALKHGLPWSETQVHSARPGTRIFARRNKGVAIASGPRQKVQMAEDVRTRRSRIDRQSQPSQQPTSSELFGRNGIHVCFGRFPKSCASYMLVIDAFRQVLDLNWTNVATFWGTAFARVSHALPA